MIAGPCGTAVLLTLRRLPPPAAPSSAHPPPAGLGPALPAVFTARLVRE
jgi:hypothetical protein